MITIKIGFCYFFQFGFSYNVVEYIKEARVQKNAEISFANKYFLMSKTSLPTEMSCIITDIPEKPTIRPQNNNDAV